MNVHHHTEPLQLADSRILSCIVLHLVSLSTTPEGTLDIRALHPLSTTCSQFLDHIRPHYMSTVFFSRRASPTDMLDMLGPDFSCVSYIKEVIVQGITDFTEWHALRQLSAHLSSLSSFTVQDLALHQAIPPGFKTLCSKSEALVVQNCILNKKVARCIASLRLEGLSFIACDFTSGVCNWGAPVVLPPIKKLCLLPHATGEQALYQKFHLMDETRSLEDVVLSVDWAGLPLWLSASEDTLQRATVIVRDMRVVVPSLFDRFTSLTHLTFSIQRKEVSTIHASTFRALHQLQLVGFILKGEHPTPSDWQHLASQIQGSTATSIDYSFFHNQRLSLSTASRICADMERYGGGEFALTASVSGADGSYNVYSYN